MGELRPAQKSVMIITMNKPGIVTAIPRHRYKYGDFTVVVLGDIESNDSVDYHLVMAVVWGSDPDPGLYVTAERTPQSGNGSADYTM